MNVVADDIKSIICFGNLVNSGHTLFEKMKHISQKILETVKSQIPYENPVRR